MSIDPQLNEYFKVVLKELLRVCGPLGICCTVFLLPSLTGQGEWAAFHYFQELTPCYTAVPAGRMVCVERDVMATRQTRSFFNFSLLKGPIFNSKMISMIII